MLTAPISGIAGHDPKPQSIVAEAKALAAILEHAHQIGLPMPFSASPTDYRAPILYFSCLADLTEWARWMEAPIVTGGEYQGRNHLFCTGAALDHQITCRAIAKVGEVVNVPLVSGETLISGGVA